MRGTCPFCLADLSMLGGAQAQAQYSLQIAIGAALGSVIVTCLATTPFEVLRIRAIEAASVDALAKGAAPPMPVDDRERPGASSSTPPPATPPTATAATTPIEAPVADPAVVDRLERLLRAPPPPLPASAYNIMNGLGTLYAEGGIRTLYSALTPLLLRELPFSITKFLVYDAATQAIAAAFPLAQEGPLASAFLSLAGGLTAGVVAAAVSTPADTLLTLSQTPSSDDKPNGNASESRTLLRITQDTLATDPLSLFNGLLPRCVFFGALIAGQFLLYDNFKQLFKVGSSDIVFYLDVFASTDLSFWPNSRSPIP